MQGTCISDYFCCYKGHTCSPSSSDSHLLCLVENDADLHLDVVDPNGDAYSRRDLALHMSRVEVPNTSSSSTMTPVTALSSSSSASSSSSSSSSLTSSSTLYLSHPHHPNHFRLHANVFLEAEQNVFRLLESDSFQRFRVHWSTMQQKKQLELAKQQHLQNGGDVGNDVNDGSNGNSKDGKEKKKGGLRKFLFSNW